MTDVLEILKSQRDKINRAIAALEELDGFARTPRRQHKRRKMSAAARKRIGDAARARWAKTKARKKAA